MDESVAGDVLINTTLKYIISGFLLVYAGILYLMRFDGLKKYLKPALIIVLCIEVGSLSSVTVNHRKTITREQFESKKGYNDESVDAIQYIKAHDTGFYRINKVFSSTLAEHDSINDAMIQGFYGTPSYSSFNKQEYIDFLTATEVINQGDERQTRWSMGLYGPTPSPGDCKC